MSFYFRDKPRFSDRLRGKSGDELLQEIKQQFDEDSKSFFEPTARTGRDPFERHGSFFKRFPLDDEDFGRRSDIRAHLDDLAARHPEFADHLLGPPWGDVPFHGSLRNRRRGSGSGSSYHPDEDARSQASGSSAASAASGASGVSSHGEPDTGHHHPQDRHPRDFEQDAGRIHIPQYGLRNTVDIGQHRHNMENSDKNRRGQRSMSAPPENRQSDQQEPPQTQATPQQPQSGQRFVSRVDITPQHNQPSQPQSPPQQQPRPQSPSVQQQKPQQQGNVRHIPIFVEGRDEPVLPRNVNHEPHFRREPSPPQFHAPPQFHRPMGFGAPFGGRQWAPHVQDSFYGYPQSAGYEQPTTARRQQPQYQQPRQQFEKQRSPQRSPQQQHFEQQRQQAQKPQAQAQPQAQSQPQQQQQPQQEPPKPKPTLPKDPLERVALVQKEVDSLAEQVKQYAGNSRKDKEYIYLDEMLTRELIKLDDIETEGRENVRQARKNAIKTIQQTIALLESKASTASQPQTPVEQSEVQIEQEAQKTEESGQTETMEVDQKQEEETKEPIPLPPGPSSPTKKSTEENQPTSSQPEEPQSVSNDQRPEENAGEAQPQEQTSSQPSEEPMDSTPAEKQETVASMEIQSLEPVNGPETNAEEVKSETTTEEKKSEATTNEKSENPEEESQRTSEEQKQKSTEVEKMEVESNQAPSETPKTPKKGKKTKKQAPVSEQPIPLPPPKTTEASAK